MRVVSDQSRGLQANAEQVAPQRCMLLYVISLLLLIECQNMAGQLLQCNLSIASDIHVPEAAVQFGALNGASSSCEMCSLEELLILTAPSGPTFETSRCKHDHGICCKSRKRLGLPIMVMGICTTEYRIY